jgi:hypothetical protein
MAATRPLLPTRRVRQWPATLRAWPHRHVRVVASVAVALFCIIRFLRCAHLPALECGDMKPSWSDIVFICGFSLFLFGYGRAVQVSARRTDLLERLTTRNVLKIDPVKVSLLDRTMNDQAEKWANFGGLLLGLLVFIGFFSAYFDIRGAIAGGGYNASSVLRRIVESPVIVLLGALEGAFGYVAGRHYGRMTINGRLGTFLSNGGHTLKIHPGHVDGAAGLKPVGDFFIFQGFLIALPAFHLSLWLLIMTFLPFPDLTRWKIPYLTFLIVMVIIGIFAFFWPLRSFHDAMVRQKQDELKRADALSLELSRIRSAIAEQTILEPINGQPGSPGSVTERAPSALRDRLDLLSKQYWDIEHMPTWPINGEILRRFTLQYFTPILTLMIFLVKEKEVLEEVWKQLSPVLGR